MQKTVEGCAALLNQIPNHCLYVTCDEITDITDMGGNNAAYVSSFWHRIFQGKFPGQETKGVRSLYSSIVRVLLTANYFINSAGREHYKRGCFVQLLRSFSGECTSSASKDANFKWLSTESGLYCISSAMWTRCKASQTVSCFGADRLLFVLTCLYLAAKQTNLFLGPKTKASPDGFTFSPATMGTLSEGQDLLAMVKAMVGEFKRMRVELLYTEGIWTTDEDYGAYSESVCLLNGRRDQSRTVPTLRFVLQPELKDGIRDGRFPAYLACVKDLSDDVLERIVPNPEQVHDLVPFLGQRFRWADQFRRLCLPRPPHGAAAPAKSKVLKEAKGVKRKRTESALSEHGSSQPETAAEAQMIINDDDNDKTPPAQEDSRAKSLSIGGSSCRSQLTSIGAGPVCTDYSGVQYFLMAKTENEVTPDQGV